MDVEENVLFFFLGFMFESCSAVDIILNLSPENVRGYLLNFKRWPLGITLVNMELEQASFWIQIRERS